MPKSLDIRSLDLDTAAKLVGLPKATIQTHVGQWLPANKDGPLDLIAYAAWLNRRLAEAQADGD